MRARAHLATQLRTTAGGGRRSCVSTLRSEAPLVLRPTRPTAAESWSAVASDAVQVSLAAGAAGPVGGDHLILEIDVGEGSSLVLSEVSPTLLLPGPHGRRSRTDVRITVAEGGTLIWLPEPVIAARACDHLNDVRVHLDDGARLLMREEVLLGRHGEPGGRVAQRVSVRLAGRPLHRQDLVHGTPVSTTPAVTGGHRAVGSVLVVDPDWVERPPTVRQVDGEAALLPLTGPAALVTALAGDNLQLRRRLAAGLAELGPPWGRNGGPTMDICTSRAPGGRVER
ncbi:MAG TPA: urease accessory protein UreD [Marmoricola sp.]|nr:urease accessory protein UreD [Marmoricola sp.]